MKIIRILLPVLFFASLGACSGDRDGQGAGQHQIAFGASDAAATDTRGTVTDSLRKVGVFGYSHEGTFTAALSERVPDYFLNQDVADLSGNGTWSYDGVRRYWPADGTLISFFAYAPFIDTEEPFVLYPALPADAGAPKIDYTVPANLYDQIDIMWDNVLDQTYSSNSGIVEFEMSHALTRIDFELKVDTVERGRPFTVTIDELTVRNLVGSGTLDMSRESADPALWTTARPATDSGWASYTMTPGGHGGLNELRFDTRNETAGEGESDSWNWNAMFKTGQYLMLIPQGLSAQADGLTPAEVELKYTVTNLYSGEVLSKEWVVPLSRASLDEWKAGMGITYQLTLKIMEGLEIEFDIEGFGLDGDPWDDINGGNPIEGAVN